MRKIKVASGGAAQGLVEGAAPRFETMSGYRVECAFGPVGALKARIEASEPADAVILTAAAIADLARAGLVAPGSSRDLGVVAAALAIRDGDALPRIAGADDLRAAILNADAVYLPDPEQATSGIHFVGVLDRLGIKEEVADRMRVFPSGAAAMRGLAQSRDARPIGCTQATEILTTPGVTIAGPLPAGLELATVYTAAIATGAVEPKAAGALIALLSGDELRIFREESGFAAA